jgi:antitoxin VapB
MTIRGKTFRSGNSQAVRLPAEIAYSEDGLELEMQRIGDQIILQPAKNNRMKEMLEVLQGLPEVPHDMTGFERMETRTLAQTGFSDAEAKYSDK